MKSFICPNCGAPVQLATGRMATFCEYCGCQVREQFTAEESVAYGKNKDFMDAMDAAIHCIESNEYPSAIKYAEKAEGFISSDPAPFLVKYIAYLDEDFNKAQTAYKLAQTMMGKNPSIAIDDQKFKDLVQNHFDNYFRNRDQDFARMFKTVRKIGGDELLNVMRFENNRRISFYNTDPVLQEGMKSAVERHVSNMKSDFKVTTQISPDNWNAIQDFRSRYLSETLTMAILDKSAVASYADVINRYSDAVDMKWESAFKSNQVQGSKDLIKSYRNEANAVLNALRRV